MNYSFIHNGDGEGDKFGYQVDTRCVWLLGPLEELSILGNMLFRSKSVKRDKVQD